MECFVFGRLMKGAYRLKVQILIISTCLPQYICQHMIALPSKDIYLSNAMYSNIVAAVSLDKVYIAKSDVVSGLILLNEMRPFLDIACMVFRKTGRS